MSAVAELPTHLRARLESAFAFQSHPTGEELKRAILRADISLRDVEPWRIAPGERPYGRKLIYFTSEVEILVMNWARNQSCLPHNHGQSIGWVKVLKGNVEHVLYERDETGLHPKGPFIEPVDSLVFAPRGIVHRMGNASALEDCVTLHFYTPPITGMEVYDFHKCLGCVVADDCGAWWPPESQLIQLKPLIGAGETSRVESEPIASAHRG